MFLRIVFNNLLFLLTHLPLLLFLALFLILPPRDFGVIRNRVSDVEDIVIVLGEDSVLPKEIEVLEFSHTINSYYIKYYPTCISIVEMQTINECWKNNEIKNEFI